MRRLVAVLCLAAVAVVSGGTGAFAEQRAQAGALGSVLVVDGDGSGSPVESGDTESDNDPSGGAAGEPAPMGAYEPVWGTRPPAGDACIDLVYRPGVSADSTLAAEWEQRTILMVTDPRLGDPSRPMCAPDAVPPSPVAAVEDFIRRIPLPEPVLRLEPGFAVTGLPTYLTIAGQDGFEVEEALAGWGRLEVALRPTAFTVDWGDGSIEAVTDGRTGGAHDADPSQHITHTYRWSDPDSAVQVRSTWEASWQLAGFGGTVPDLAIDATLDVPVRSYQAVRADR